MKKLILAFSLFLFGSMAFAQSTFDKQIKENSAKLNKATTAQEYTALFTEFSNLIRVQDANRWKAYYYAGLSQYKKAEILIKAGDKAGASEANAIAYKYVAGGVPQDNTDGKKLLEQIKIQSGLLK